MTQKHCCRQLFSQEAEHIVSSATVKTEEGAIEALENSTKGISEARSNPDAVLVNHELRKAGFACTILEARHRPGGRNWTIRGGDKVEFTDGTVQSCDWKDGGYFNAGPARIP